MCHREKRGPVARRQASLTLAVYSVHISYVSGFKSRPKALQSLLVFIVNNHAGYKYILI